MENQAYLFMIFVINGILIGILFDIFRILRKSFKTSDFITYIQDIIFWLLTGVITMYFVFAYNSGEIRIYVFLGILFGIVMYILTISKYFVKFSVKIITTLKKVISKVINIILYPFNIVLKLLRKLLFRPISFVCINLRNFSTKSKENIINFLKKPNKVTKKQT